MVRIPLALVGFSIVGLLLGGCAKGTSCGRGRCSAGACVDVISTYASSKDLQLDWWCVVPCSGDMHCQSSMCLQSPIDDSLKVCSGSSVELKYVYNGGAIPGASDGGVSRTLKSYSVEAPDGTVSCIPGVVCNAGWFNSGQDFPNVVGVDSAGNEIHLVNGMPGMSRPRAASAGADGVYVPLGPYLPTGLPIVITVDGAVEPLY